MNRKKIAVILTAHLVVGSLLCSSNDAYIASTLQPIVDALQLYGGQQVASMRSKYEADIQTLSNTIATFDDQQKAEFTSKLSGVKTTLKTVVSEINDRIAPITTTAVQTLNGYITKYKNGSLSKNSVPVYMQQVSKNTEQTIQRFVLGYGQQVNIALSNVKNQVDRIAAIAQQKETIAANQEYMKKVRAITLAFSGQVAEMLAAEKLERDLLINYIRTDQLNIVDMQSLVNRYQTILNVMYPAYKNAEYTIDFTDQTNYVTYITNKMFSLFFNDASMSLAKGKQQFLTAIQKQDNSYRNKYYDHLAQLHIRFVGTGKSSDSELVQKGYVGIVSACAKKYYDPNESVVTGSFAKNRKNICMQPFIDGLQDLVSTMTQPTDQQVASGWYMFQEIKASLYLLEDSVKQSTTDSANTNIATLYASWPQSLFEKMDPKKYNDVLRSQVITAYTTASTYFGDASDKSNSALYKGLADKLAQATKALKAAQTAEQSGDVSTAVTQYKSASLLFAESADLKESNLAKENCNTLLANQQKDIASKALQNFLATYKTKFQSYMAFISVVEKQETLSMEAFSPMLAALQTAAKKASNAYKKAEPALKNIGKSTVALQEAAALFDLLDNLLTTLKSGDENSVLLSQTGLSRAQNYYAQTLNSAMQIDAQYTKKLAPYFSVYPTALMNTDLSGTVSGSQKWNFVTLVNRHIARQYIDFGAALSNQVLVQIQYYTAAGGARNRYLTPSMQGAITTKLDALKKLKGQSGKIYKNAQTQEAAAKRLKSSDWAASKNDLMLYDSTANTAWKSVLSGYWSAYSFGVAKALADYERVVKLYATAYKSNVDQQYNPAMTSAFILYNNYVLATMKKDTTTQSALFDSMETDIQPSFAQAQKYVDDINATDLVSSATGNVEQLSMWMQSADQSVAGQENSMGLLAPSVQKNTLILLSKTTSAMTKDVTYSFGKSGENPVASITIKNPGLMQAEVYQKVADAAFAKKDYRQAYQAYEKAQNAYDKLGQTEKAAKAKGQYNLSYTRTISYAYANSIIPNDKTQHGIKMMKVAGISVPESYEMYSYNQKIPTNIFPPPIAFDTIMKDPKKAQDLMKKYAVQMFMYNALGNYGIAYNSVFSSSGAVLDPPNVPSSQYQLVLDIVNDGTAFKKRLEDRVAKKESVLKLTAENNSIYLFEEYMVPFTVRPVSRTLITQMPYRSYPVATDSFYWARMLSDPTKKTVSYGQKSLVSGNDPELVNSMLEKTAQAYLVAGKFYKNRFDYLINGGDIKLVDPLMDSKETKLLTDARTKIAVLKQVSKTDMSQKIGTYLPMYNVVKEYVQKIILMSYTYSQYYYKKIGQQSNTANITNAMNDMYELLGDVASLFLIGDPQSPLYFVNGAAYGGGQFTGQLAEMQKQYTIAFSNDPKRASKLQKKIAGAFVSAGDILVGKGKELGSTDFYKLALSAYKRMKPVDVQNFKIAGRKLAQALFKGATDKFGPYQKAKMGSVKISETEALPLKTIIAKGLGAPTNRSQGEEAAYSMIRNSVLDAMIYYQDTSAWASIAQNPLADPTKKADDSSSDAGTPSSKNKKKKPDPITQAGLDLISTYTKQNNMPFETLTDVNNALKRSDFLTVVQTAFDQFSNKAASADSKTSKIGFAAIGQWSNMLFSKIGIAYQNDFYAGLSVSARFEKWMSDIKAQKQNNLANPSQYLGGDM